MKKVVGKEKGNKWMKGGDSVDEIKDGSLDDNRGLERAYSIEVCESITSDLCMLLERRL